jgi:NADPH-dependent 7-cyano-7-deazaguanine reductase QueF
MTLPMLPEGLDMPTAFVGRVLKTMPCDPQRIMHTLPLPSCCPISGNPLSGSAIRLRYQAEGRVLEVYDLKRYLEGFMGGWGQVRTMEGMVQQIADDAAHAVGVPVAVRATLLLHPGQQMTLRAKGTP